MVRSVLGRDVVVVLVLYCHGMCLDGVLVSWVRE